ncbi:hypothetical protein ACIP4S_13370 [Streptomyces chartreusis]|uniref:hypothetical protein n=1 Tax=Streptomyces chartreusis TaxID=1969 RepID=UPI003805EA63
MHTSIAHTPVADGRPTTPGQWDPYALPSFVPPLFIAREQARRVFDEAAALDVDTAAPGDVYGSHGALLESMRQVLAALDAEDGCRE